MKTAAIVNPRSASGRTGRLWNQLAARLGPVDVRFTKAPNHATELTRELVSEGFQRLISVGGDGTINEIVNGLITGDQPVASDVCLAILPLGTGSDFQKTLGIRTLDEAIALLESSREPAPMDVGKVVHQSLTGRTATRYFANLVSFGMGGEVAAKAKNVLSPLSGKAAFLWATLDVFFRYRAKTVTVEVDGNPIGKFTVTNVAVGNGRFHGGGMHVCPRGRIDDGLLEVTVIDALGMYELARDIRILYTDDLYVHPKTHHWQGRVVKATSEGIVSIEVDGEPLGFLPVEISLLSRLLRVLCPAR